MAEGVILDGSEETTSLASKETGTLLHETSLNHHALVKFQIEVGCISKMGLGIARSVHEINHEACLIRNSYRF